jgi:hypothetical protein
VVSIDDTRRLKTNELLNTLDCTIKDKIKLKEILRSLDNEDVETGSIYELISQKTHKDQSTIKKFMAKITGRLDNKLLRKLGIKNKPKGKEFLIHLYRTINENEDT